MPTNAYATLAELKAFLGVSGTGDDLRLDQVLTAASRQIEMWCDRKFWLDAAASPTVRQFAAADRHWLDLGRHEIGAATPVTVQVDSAGDGTYETTLSSTDYTLGPVNAPVDFPEPLPYRWVQALSGSWPLPHGSLAREERVKVTARYGWPAVPADVSEACLLLSAETYKLKDAPYGVVGFSEFGVVRVRDNPKVAGLLAGYRWPGVLVG
jgi:hypothetical protein